MALSESAMVLHKMLVLVPTMRSYRISSFNQLLGLGWSFLPRLL